MENKAVHHVLDNGLNIYFYRDNSKHSVVVDLIVKYGRASSDFEVNGKEYHLSDGVAHLLEHLLYEKNKFGDFGKILGEKQMTVNAATWDRVTNYYFDTVDNVYFGLEKLILGISDPVFTPEDVEEIKGPIYQEIRMRADEIGRRILYKTRENVFKNISYISGLGTLEEVEKIDYKLIKFVYDTFYQPKNQILLVCGNFDEKEMLSAIKKIYKNIKTKEVDFSFIKIKEPNEVVKNYDVIVMPVPKTFVDVCYKVDISKHSKKERRIKDYYFSMFLQMNFSESSPIHKELISKKVIDEYIYADYSNDEEYSLIGASAYVNDVDLFTKKIRSVFEKKRYNNKETFDLKLKRRQFNNICADPIPGAISNSLLANISEYDYPDLDSLEEIKSLSYEDYLKFIDSLEFKHFTVNLVVNEE